jgi:hypothetical protein
MVVHTSNPRTKSLRQDPEFEASLGYVERSSLNPPSNTPLQNNRSLLCVRYHAKDSKYMNPSCFRITLGSNCFSLDFTGGEMVAQRVSGTPLSGLGQSSE